MDLYSDRLFTALERADPAPGMLLLAAPDLPSADFSRSVILLVAHDAHMSFGVNLATRSDVPVDNVMPEWTPLVSKPQALYIGGPLQQQSVVGLGVTASGISASDSPYFSKLANRMVHVDLRADPEELTDLVSGLRLFVGYAEWSAGQLEEEIERGDWFVTPALPDDILAPGAKDVWGDVMRRQAMPLPLFATYPGDVNNN